MAQITSEDKKKLKRLVSDLDDVNSALRVTYRQIMWRILRSYIYLFVWIGMVFMLPKYIVAFDVVLCTFIFSCMMCLMMTLYFYFMIKPKCYIYKEFYNQGLTLLNSLVEYVDWNVYRKRQLYRDTDSHVESVIDDFFHHMTKTITPTNPNNYIFKILLITQIILIYSTFIYAAVLFYEYFTAYLY